MAVDNRKIIEISPKTMFWALGIGALAVLAYMVRDVISVLIFAIIIASALEPLLEYSQSKKIPRLLALIVIYLLFFVFFAALIYILLPLLLDQLSDFSQNYPIYFGKIEEAAGTVTFLPGLSGNVHELLSQLTEQIPSFTSLFSYASSIFGGIVSLVVVLVVSFYLSLSRGALDGFLSSVLPPKFESYIHELWIRAQKKMGRWLQAQILLSIIMAVTVGIGLWILGVKYAFLIAIVVGVLEIVPYVGPIVSGALATLLALSQSATLGFWTLIFFIAAQQLENHILVPLLIKKLLGLNPVAVILAIMIGAKLGGVFGILLAVPLAAVVDEFFDDLARKKSTPSSHPQI
ncbi:MAG: AI-2E family transporter [Candidatus Azambacteria bacterium]|nr:AI-2E family transporter [Candidatus Azambacteria bacterium]